MGGLLNTSSMVISIGATLAASVRYIEVIHLWKVPLWDVPLTGTVPRTTINDGTTVMCLRHSLACAPAAVWQGLVSPFVECSTDRKF